MVLEKCPEHPLFLDVIENGLQALMWGDELTHSELLWLRVTNKTTTTTDTTTTTTVLF